MIKKLTIKEIKEIKSIKDKVVKNGSIIRK
jgi:hypothetical protein